MRIYYSNFFPNCSFLKSIRLFLNITIFPSCCNKPSTKGITKIRNPEPCDIFYKRSKKKKNSWCKMACMDIEKICTKLQANIIVHNQYAKVSQ